MNRSRRSLTPLADTPSRFAYADFDSDGDIFFLGELVGGQNSVADIESLLEAIASLNSEGTSEVALESESLINIGYKPTVDESAFDSGSEIWISQPVGAPRPQGGAYCAPMNAACCP